MITKIDSCAAAILIAIKDEDENWVGYNALSDKTGFTKLTCTLSMTLLHSTGYVKREPLYYENEFRGTGWFVTDKIKELF